MAYVSQELKAKLSPKIKAVCKKYGVKASIGVDNHSTLVLNIRSAKIDFIANYNSVAATKPGFSERGGYLAKDYLQVNTYYTDEHFTGKAKNFLREVIDAMNVGNFDKSDSQTDYFHCGWYVNVNVGRWNKPFVVEK